MLPRAGAYEGWEQVAETRQVYEAELMALRLREAGVPAEVLDQTFYQEPLPTVRSFAVVRVLVPREKAELARDVLARSEPLDPGLSDQPEGPEPPAPPTENDR